MMARIRLRRIIWKFGSTSQERAACGQWPIGRGMFPIASRVTYGGQCNRLAWAIRREQQ